MRIIRSIAAVAAGFVFMISTVIVGTIVASALFIPGGFTAAVADKPPVSLPLAYLVANLAISAMGALLGGWLAARVGASHPFAHAAALAAIVAGMSILTIANGPSAPQPAWYTPVVGVIGVAGVLAGGTLRSAAARES